jgi:hypothetical protein
MSLAAQVPLACATCHRLLDVRVCKSNKNGNEGKRFVSCHKRHTNGTSCSYYYWLDRSQGSISLSPSRSSSPSPTSGSTQASTSLLPSPPPTLPVPTPARPLTIKLPSRMATEPTRCAKTGCKSMRLHPDCLRHMCRRHCAEAGGCHAKGHSAVGPASASGSRREIPVSRSPTSPVSPRDSSAITTSAETDMFADPRYASQMTAAFTKHYALEQSREELRRAADTERLANIDKAKHHVVIYSWPKVCPGVCSVFSLLISILQ